MFPNTHIQKDDYQNNTSCVFSIYSYVNKMITKYQTLIITRVNVLRE